MSDEVIIKRGRGKTKGSKDKVKRKPGTGTSLVTLAALKEHGIKRGEVINPTGIGGFVKGQVYAPHGVHNNKMRAEVKEQFSHLIPEAIGVLIRGMRDDDLRIALPAADKFLDRAMGKVVPMREDEGDKVPEMPVGLPNEWTQQQMRQALSAMTAGMEKIRGQIEDKKE